MSILINKNTKVLIQGITGREGRKASKEMIDFGTSVLAGVTPGKGGFVTEEKVPVFNSVTEALEKFPEINASLIVVPPAFVLDAALETIKNKIPLINILTEKIPVVDVAKIIAYAREVKVKVVGPSSIGILVPDVSKIGSIGSSANEAKIFSKGDIGVVSKSGGMTAEISNILTKNNLGQSTVVGIGGDLLIGSNFSDITMEFEKDDETKAVVIFGEVGGTYEEDLAEKINAGLIKKPIVALIAGKFTETLPQDTVLGHAGAIVNKGRGSARSKIKLLKEAGVFIAETPEDIPIILKNLQIKS